MNQNSNQQIYDLQDKTCLSKNVRIWVKNLPKNTGNIEDAKQVIRYSGSVGANYIESKESLSNKNLSEQSKRKHLMDKTNPGNK